MSANVVIPWMLLSAGAAGLTYTAWSIWRALTSRSWPLVAGRILTSRVAVEGGGKGGPSYRAAISYEYEVGGRKYQANRVHFGDGLASTWGQRLAQREVSQHPVGSSVSVRYDAIRPTRATLETGLKWYFLIDFLFWVVFLFIPIAMLRHQP